MLYWVLFAFVAFGSKLILAGITVYLILPADTRCTACDGETLLLRMGRGGRVASLLSNRSLQRRWCPRCGWQGTTRTGRRERRGNHLAPRAETPASPIRR